MKPHSARSMVLLFVSSVSVPIIEFMMPFTRSILDNDLMQVTAIKKVFEKYNACTFITTITIQRIIYYCTLTLLTLKMLLISWSWVSSAWGTGGRGGASACTCSRWPSSAWRWSDQSEVSTWLHQPITAHLAHVRDHGEGEGDAHDGEQDAEQPPGGRHRGKVA